MEEHDFNESARAFFSKKFRRVTVSSGYTTKDKNTYKWGDTYMHDEEKDGEAIAVPFQAVKLFVPSSSLSSSLASNKPPFLLNLGPHFDWQGANGRRAEEQRKVGSKIERTEEKRGQPCDTPSYLQVLMPGLAGTATARCFSM